MSYSLEENDYNPSNPGSWDHLMGTCRPCNKFIFGKPNSCKNDSKCTYCHSSNHSKSIHRGQRARHAIQKKQFNEQCHMYPIWYQELVQNIYSVTEQIYSQFKVHLYTIQDINKRSQLIIYISKSITDIGHIFQEKRECHRSNNSRFIPPQIMKVSDLDGRIKWLKGTIHLVIRKMWESTPEELKEQKIKYHIDEFIDMFNKLADNINEKIIENFEDVSKQLSIMYTIICNEVPEEALIWILPKIEKLTMNTYTLEDTISIGNIFFRFPKSVYYDNNLKNIIADETILSLHTLVETLEQYLNTILDTFFSSIIDKFKNFD